MEELLIAAKWLFADTSLIATLFGFTGVIIIVSSMANHQSKENKILNTIKAFVYTLMLIAITNIAYVNSSGMISYASILIGLIGFVMIVAGDWIAFFIYKLNLCPGGVGGWIWSSIGYLAKKVNNYAQRRFEDTLDHSEMKLANLLQLHRDKTVEKEVAAG